MEFQELRVKLESPPTKGRKRAILVSTGSMCPIHKGHLTMFDIAARFLKEEFGIDPLVGYISPSCDDYLFHKLGSDMILFQHRYEMTKLACKEHNEQQNVLHVFADSWEGHQPKFVNFPEVRDHFESELKKLFPEKEFIVLYLTGADHFNRCNLIKSSCCVAIGRVGCKIEAKSDPKRNLFICDSTKNSGIFTDFSSTAIREAIKKGEAFEKMTFKSVANYMKEVLHFGNQKVENVLNDLAFEKVEALPTDGIYSLEKLKNACSKGCKFNFVFFLNFNENDINLNPPKPGCFSLFFPSIFHDKEGIQFSHCIQYMMSQKADLFNDSESKKTIMNLRDPAEIKQAGRNVKNFDLNTWNHHVQDIVYKGNLYKFSQNEKLHDFILSFPPNTIFVEANPHDSFYSIHLNSDDPKVKDPFKWEGENQLGFMITKVRDDFIKSTMNGQFITHAYSDQITVVKKSDNNICRSLDFLSSSVKFVDLNNYKNLTQIRISKCNNLSSVQISNMPNLRVVDLLDNRRLQSVEFINCPKFVTLDVGFCKSLKSLKGIETLEYLSAPSCSSLDSFVLPSNIVFLDLSRVPSIDTSLIIHNLHDLECFVFTEKKSLKLSEITSNSSLKILHLSSTKIICDNISKGSCLKVIIFEDAQMIKECIEGDINLLKNIYVTSKNDANQDLNNFDLLDNFNPKYQIYQRMIYGPWGIPNIDLTPPKIVLEPIIVPPKPINQAKTADSILGSIIASAVLDMVGVGVEFITNGIAKALLPGKLNIAWTHPRCNRHNERFVRGTPTDDTSQTILIMRSIVDLNIPQNRGKTSHSSKIVKGVKIDPLDFGLKLIEWIQHGHIEHKHPGGLGVGSTTLSVVNNPKFITDPITASYEAWISSGKKAAPNGSVMRIASSGCFAFWDEEIVTQIAECYCKVTHFDPRAVYCSIAAAIIIARYVQWNSGLIKDEPDIDKALKDAEKYAPGIEAYKSEVEFYMNSDSIEKMNMSENGKIGYCLKAFGSAIWALRYCNSIEEALVKVIREGGDTDTNGAVVGALLGAKFGFNAIPQEMIKYMFVENWMLTEIAPYLQLMGIEMPFSL